MWGARDVVQENDRFLHSHWQVMCWFRAAEVNKKNRSKNNQSKYTTVADRQSPPILRPWVFLFGTWQERPRRLGNAAKPVFRIYWRDWHEPISLKLNIYHFEPQNFGGAQKQLAKNTEKCAIDSFFKAEDDPTKLDHFYKPFGRYIASKVTYSHPNIIICHHIYV